MQRILLFATAVLLISFWLPVVATADVPTTQSTDSKAVMAFMLAYDQLAGDGPDAYMAMYAVDAGDDETHRLAIAEAKFDAEVGILQKMVQQMWGDDAVDQAVHALGLKSTKDIQSAIVQEGNDHAKVTFADGTPGPELVKTPQGWRLNLAAFRQSLGMPVDDYLKQLRQLGKILPDVADGITTKKLTTAAGVTQDIVKRINATP